MEEANVRYGVVNESKRVAYEKKWQVQMGYDYLTFNLEDAQSVCRKKGDGFVVEKIFNIPHKVVNYKTVIFRGGDYKE